MENQGFQLWRLPALGITSEDFMQKDDQNATKAHYGVTWRFAKDQDYRKAQAKLQAEKKADSANAQASGKQTAKKLKNHLTDEAEKMGLPMSQPDTASPEEQQEAQDELSQRVAASAGFTEAQLSAQPIDALKEIAASLGVTNLEMGKKKLINAILEKQL